MRLRFSRRRDDESGYAAILVSMMMVLLMAMAGFAVDVSNWYLTGQHAQRAADAAALSGVTKLPGDPSGAFTTAEEFAKQNGFDDAAASTAVVTAVDGQPTRLRVTVTDTVQNVFGSLLGIDETTITRTAVADYAGPVAMGSPCNAFGDDPESTTSTTGASCAGVAGLFWANVAGPKSPKVSGDKFQAGTCASGNDGCSGTTNTDYDPNGYFYTLHVAKPVSNLTLEIFDPALINVGDRCENNLDSTSPKASAAQNNVVPGTTESTVYAGGTGATKRYCTGDIRFGGTGEVATRFQLRSPSAAPWDPLTYPLMDGCSRTFPGYNGNLYNALNQSSASYKPEVAETFRRWVPLCTQPSLAAGDYLIQVNTNGLGSDGASGHNRFAMRAYSSTDPTAKDNVSISGRGKMAIYANLPSAKTEFYLARVPTSSAGQLLNLQFFDVGDSNQPGTITIKAPSDSGVTFTRCTGVGVVNGPLTNCTVSVGNSAFQGKDQLVSVAVPTDYKCQDLVPSACWATLEFNYGTGGAPTDTTSWQANIAGDPVRLVE